MENQITEALNTLIPELTELYEEHIRTMAERIFEEFGPTLRGVRNSWTHAQNYQLVRSVFVCDDPLSYHINVPHHIDYDRVMDLAKSLATEAAHAWKGKLIAKLGKVTDVEIHSHGNASFNISAKVNDHQVRIDQQIVVKVSCKGKWFNQFPARIYVDGKFLSEKKFNELYKQD